MDSHAVLYRPIDPKVSSCRRQVAQTEKLIADFARLTAELDHEVRAEEDRTEINDPAHFACSTLAKASSQRRDNLRRSINRLRVQLNIADNDLQKVIEASQSIPSENAIHQQ